MTAAAISAQLVDIRNVGMHKAVKLTLHAPEEHALAIMKAFGWPTMVNPVSVAVARLNEVPAPQDYGASSSDEREPASDSGLGAERGRRTFTDMLPAQQAGMLCSDRAFRLFLAEKFDMPLPDPEEAANIIRHHCKVKSRKDITTDNPDWSGLVLAYRLWQREPEYVG